MLPVTVFPVERQGNLEALAIHPAFQRGLRVNTQPPIQFFVFAGGEPLNLFEQGRRVEHHAAGYHALDLRPEDAAGDQREFERLAAGDDRVARVRSSLVADHHVMMLGQQVEDLALGLVAPLQSNHTGPWHGRRPTKRQLDGLTNTLI